MSFSGMEWCPGADGEFGVCESTTGPSPPGENATEETPLVQFWLLIQPIFCSLFWLCAM